MSYTAIQSQPITINLTQAALDTGWSIDGFIATHESCNSGRIRLTGYDLIAGHTYQISYAVLNISGGLLRMDAGTTLGIPRVAAGLYVETIVAGGTNPQLTYYSDANCQIHEFNIRDTAEDTSNFQRNTLTYSAITKKWTDFRTFAPDFGFSLNNSTYTLHYGDFFSHENSSENSRNNFYGVQYKSVIELIENKNPNTIKTFKSISLQSNTLLVTTDNGITTSLGQVSDLVADDFLKAQLTDDITFVDVYTQEGVYSAGFLRDSNEDILEGSVLKGNWLTCSLIQETGPGVLRLFCAAVVTSQSKIGSR